MFGKCFLFEGVTSGDKYSLLQLEKGISPGTWKFAPLDPQCLILCMAKEDAYVVVFGPVSLESSVEISSLISTDQE